jgi:hypothetical protein
MLRHCEVLLFSLLFSSAKKNFFSLFFLTLLCSSFIFVALFFCVPALFFLGSVFAVRGWVGVRVEKVMIMTCILLLI